MKMMNPRKNVHEKYSLQEPSKVNRLINSSVTHSPIIYTNRLSNNTNLTNNYAPIEKQLEDSLYQRNTHPLAKYLQDLPLYPNMLTNTGPLEGIAKANSMQNEQKINSIINDRVRLTSNNSGHFDNHVVTPVTYTEMSKSEQNKNFLNPQLNILRERSRNEEMIKDLMYKKSGITGQIIDNSSNNSELKNTYPISNVNLAVQESFGRRGKFSQLFQSMKERFTHKDPPNISGNREVGTYVSTSNSDDVIKKTNEITSSINEIGKISDHPKKVKIIPRKSKESFTKENETDTYTDQVYIQSLESRLISVINYLKTNESYKKWIRNWNSLEKALKNSNFSFSRLDECDNDIAYTVNKGEKTKFRIRGKDRKYVPLNIYQYVMLHEAAHCANYGNWGHGKDFCDLLSILCLASYELGYINLQGIHKQVYLTNGQPIVCRSDMKKEILAGIELVRNENIDKLEFYNQLEEHIKSK